MLLICRMWGVCVCGDPIRVWLQPAMHHTLLGVHFVQLLLTSQSVWCWRGTRCPVDHSVVSFRLRRICGSD